MEAGQGARPNTVIVPIKVETTATGNMLLEVDAVSYSEIKKGLELLYANRAKSRLSSQRKRGEIKNPIRNITYTEYSLPSLVLPQAHLWPEMVKQLPTFTEEDVKKRSISLGLPKFTPDQPQ